MIARRIRNRVRKAVTEAWLSTGLPAALDRRAFARAAAPRGGEPRGHVVLAPPGGGNIGDQALVEAFVENTTGPVTLIVRGAGDIHVPEHLAARVTVVALPHLVYRSDAAHRADLAALRRILVDAESFSVVGADIMDGRYSMRASINRSVAAELAASLGVDSRILGFSWNGSARPAARRAIVRATVRGAVPLLRDPVSADRARRDGLVGVREVADIVFSAETVDRSIASRVLPAGIRSAVIVNLSGLVGRSVDQVAEYERVIAHLRVLGRHIVVLPHVTGGIADDDVACHALVGRVGREGLTLVDRILEPAEVRGLCAAAELVITGRMHLAVMAMWNGVPAITLSTQGKVEGLMRLLDCRELCVEPRPGFGERIVRLIDETLPAEAPVRSAIARNLDRVTALARRNLDGLPVASGRS